MKDLVKWVAYLSVFTVPFVLLIVSGSLFFPYITGKNFAFRLVVEIGFAAWVLLALYDKTYRPKLSYILYAILGLVGVMFVADLFGEYAPKSFWSNYERMEGWITLLHFFLYFIVAGSLLNTEKLWNKFFNVSLIAAVLMSLFAIGQMIGAVEVSQGTSWRVDGRLGNSSYLGVYMLFQMFISAWMYTRAKTKGRHLIYAGLFVLFAFILFNTGTRGTVLGLAGGCVLAFLYTAFAAPRGAVIKKWALGSLVGVLLAVGGLVSLKDTSFIKDSPMLNRFVNISLSEGNVRFMVWQVALKGVAEHPILGWGQENFNYVFNKYYDPKLYVAEPWYDRTHNIFLDWLIAGGVLGLLAYLAILFVTLLKVILMPAWKRLTTGQTDETHFSVTEQALILGLLAAYMFHNLFVFDNLASWIFYAVILALVHSRIAKPITSLEKIDIERDIVDRMITPMVLVVVGVAIYFVNIPGILAAHDIILAYQDPTVDGRLAVFERALGRGSFADQEIAEQFAQVFGAIVNNPDIPNTKRLEIKASVNDAMNKLNNKKPGDARVYIVKANFNRMAGDFQQALKDLDTSSSLSPNKSNIYEEQGIIYLSIGDYESALKLFWRAYELNTGNNQSRVRLAAALLASKSTTEAEEILDLEHMEEGGALWYAFVNDNLMIAVAYQEKRYDWLLKIMDGRIIIDPKNPEWRQNLASLYYEMGNREKAISTVEKAIVDIPTFKATGTLMIEELKK